MTIQPYSRSPKPQLADRMAAYMTELGFNDSEEIIRVNLTDFIDRQCESGIIRLDMAMDGENCIGFSVYQIDTPESDWCKRPGWGFIREYYVAPPYRKQGLGRQLAAHTEQCLQQMGAKQLYLTSTEAVPFWQRCGWTLTDILCSNGQYILEKFPLSFQPIAPGDSLWDAAAEYAEKCSWRAGGSLAALMKGGAFSDWERVILALSGEEICGYCTVTKTDCIPNLSYSPYIGYLFVDEAHRGHRLSGQILEFASQYLHSLGFSRVYLISDHENLYEKYGFSVIDRQPAPWGSFEKIYAKEI